MNITRDKSIFISIFPVGKHQHIRMIAGQNIQFLFLKVIRFSYIIDYLFYTQAQQHFIILLFYFGFDNWTKLYELNSIIVS